MEVSKMGDELLKELDDMINISDENIVEEEINEDPDPEPEGDLEPAPEPEPDPDPDPDPDKDEESKPEEDPPEPEPEPEIDLETVKKENEELRKRIDEMSAPKPPEPEPPKEPEPPAPLVLDEVDFIGEDDIDDITRDPVAFNRLLNKIYTQGVNTSRDRIGEGVLRSIPDIVKNNVTTVIALKKASDEFYDENEDLKPFRKVVGAVFEEKFAENPGGKYGDLMKDVGIEVRNRLELHLKAVNSTSDSSNPPKLPRKKGQKRKSSAKPNTDPMLAEIDKMNELEF